MPILRDELLALLPDAPGTVQMRALLDLGETQLFGTVSGAAFAHAEAALGVVVGTPTAETLSAFFATCGRPEELLAHTPLPLPGYRWGPLQLFTLPTPSSFVPGAVRLGPEHWPRVPGSHAEAVAVAMERRAVFCVEAAGELVGFAWAPWRSEGFCDVWVDVLPQHRRRGLGQQVAAALLRHEVKEGHAPVWCAPKDDVAAVGLARALGFVPSAASLWRAHRVLVSLRPSRG